MRGLLTIAALTGAVVLAVASCPAAAAAADPGSAAELRARFAALADKLAYNQFRRPL